MKCPICGAAELVHDTRDMPYIYKGETTIISTVTGDFFPACDEAVLGVAEATRTSAAMLDFNKQINAAIVEPRFSISARSEADQEVEDVREKAKIVRKA